MKTNPTKAYIKYAGMTMQMVAALGIGYFLGNLLDKLFSLETPWFGITGCLLFLGAFFYKLIVDLNNK